jgi:hypothetical protein
MDLARDASNVVDQVRFLAGVLNEKIAHRNSDHPSPGDPDDDSHTNREEREPRHDRHEE